MKTETKHARVQFDIVDCDDETWLYLGSEPIAEFHSMRDNALNIAEACNNYERVKAERDELAAALKEAKTWLSTYDLWSDVLKRNMLIRKIESALAKLEDK